MMNEGNHSASTPAEFSFLPLAPSMLSLQLTTAQSRIVIDRHRHEPGVRESAPVDE